MSCCIFSIHWSTRLYGFASIGADHHPIGALVFVDIQFDAHDVRVVLDGLGIPRCSKMGSKAKGGFTA
jgi:hypothetical protein